MKRGCDVALKVHCCYKAKVERPGPAMILCKTKGELSKLWQRNWFSIYCAMYRYHTKYTERYRETPNRTGIEVMHQNCGKPVM